LFLARLALAGRATPSSVELLVKSKPLDDDVIDVGQSVARLAAPELGDAYAQFRAGVGFTQSHLRELALYGHADARLRRNTPRVYAVVRDDETKRWTIVMERVTETVALPPVESDTPWPASYLEVALRGLAEVHAVWYGREQALRAEPWLGPVRDSSRLVAMTPLWSALARHAQRYSTAWRVEGLAAVHEELVSHIGNWTAPSCGPRTLIHNDFNPRNVTLRAGAEPRLCAYDWELATIGLPQRDLAELLCFTLSPRATHAEVQYWVDFYRKLLTAETRSVIDLDAWSNGFRVALGELLIDRLAMYAMVDRIRPQRFLPRVVRTWLTLWRATSCD
jgi:aminoglycoside phosphotransferase (APT) family kinase protein